MKILKLKPNIPADISSTPCKVLPEKPESYDMRVSSPLILNIAPNGLKAKIANMKIHRPNLPLSAIL